MKVLSRGNECLLSFFFFFFSYEWLVFTHITFWTFGTAASLWAVRLRGYRAGIDFQSIDQFFLRSTYYNAIIFF